MNVNEVIDSYVADVAAHLPRRQRNDVAFELRALLDEELQARAEETGRAVDAGMAVDFLNGFGRPEEVAARYRPAVTIVDPADGRSFLRATWIGLAVFWSLGLLGLQQSISTGRSVLSAIGEWWVGSIIPTLWWPGMLVAGFGLAAWARRRWPQSSPWKPRGRDHLAGGRVALVMALLGIVCGLAVLVEPRWILDFFWNGKAAPAAYRALTYTDTFLRGPAPWLLASLALNLPLFAAVIVSGRWSPMLRRIEVALGLATCAAMAWTVMDGPVLMAESSDQMARGFMVVAILGTLATHALRMAKRVAPAPGQLPTGRR